MVDQIFNNSKNLASSSEKLRTVMNDTAGAEDGMQRESLNSPTQALHFHSRSGMLLHTAGTCFDPTIYIAELNLGKFVWNFKAGRLTSELRFV